jgi:hypothetical protein
LASALKTRDAAVIFGAIRKKFSLAKAHRAADRRRIERPVDVFSRETESHTGPVSQSTFHAAIKSQPATGRIKDAATCD